MDVLVDKINAEIKKKYQKEMIQRLANKLNRYEEIFEFDCADIVIFTDEHNYAVVTSIKVSRNSVMVNYREKEIDFKKPNIIKLGKKEHSIKYRDLAPSSMLLIYEYVMLSD
ncbi:hypothetical protein M2451_000561 [Dysgonomonas sp. PFB1-18]|uniref:hypothetical protein n=1 Tax=unclassified Dysgonomonas TaxID=2630389 RepID=UPI002476C153|nr:MULTISPECIES: hypothetical protein [unclassified Dysgonomonas]MDH6307412.1 hypothetical protein [Dysgonomonas sp. PF1-14]MDH6337330.1 hypothetical protein [Dysgonomonas sp. PF1-16]MDH6379254.1 hypothetical protein [Dysgonomonas sp. PFB1-18]MDH6396108.1 hypothetical protein [Dysgonomonas sp. PF1-23]